MTHRQLASPRSRTNEARLTNNPWVLPGVDGRSAEARRFYDLCTSFAAEFGRGGAGLAETQRVLIRNAAAAAMAAEAMQTKLVSGDAVDPDAIARVTGASAKSLGELRERAVLAEAQA